MSTVPPAGPATATGKDLRGKLGLVWVAGLLVAIGAGVATAHGLYEVALAAGVPQVLAWLYPLITDGLALVAYATTTRLTQHGRRYAWTVVVVAAALSGLTQASYLAGSVAVAPPVLRFAIGAWPALAAAIVAHLLYLLGGTHDPIPPAPTGQSHPDVGTTPAHVGSAGQLEPASTALPTPAATAPDPVNRPLPTAGSDHLSAGRATPVGGAHWPAEGNSPQHRVGHRLDTRLDNRSLVGHPVEHPIRHPPDLTPPPSSRPTGSPAGNRALTLAREHATRHGHLPTVRELASLARVARGTAAAALKDLRQHPVEHPAGKPTSNARRHP